ncbi:hypothetical protein GCM10010401_15870 [Rarobacter faecitabidus]|uniref:Integral membrane protein n=1 Tax=Rarobacter faecitabidus TaxID=13243 RepID=A0A542ZXD1_RARFA|nr:hypothetical protein [Rarobacter faecitabidus]TQL65011.1 hypothetical protein FB461_1544 [Rarobacter faecitabidus]
MTALYDAFLVLHLVGWAIVLGGYMATVKQPGIYKGTLHGALTALVSGIAMVGIAEMSDAVRDPNMVKIGIKLTIALVVVALAFIGKNRGDAVPAAVKHAIGGLTVVNIIIAVFV